MTHKVKTGIFSGSFNPIHIGHLALANYLCEYEGLDELWFVVSPQNPLKRTDDMLDEEKRLELVRASIKGYSKFRASNIEFTLPRPSYTISTLEHLRNRYPEREFTLIIGSDNWQSFDRWKESERIIKEYAILIYPRPEYPIATEQLPPSVRIAQTPLLEISSTFIRKSLAEGKEVNFFLHPECYQIIQKEGLYLKHEHNT